MVRPWGLGSGSQSRVQTQRQGIVEAEGPVEGKTGGGQELTARCWAPRLGNPLAGDLSHGSWSQGGGFRLPLRPFSAFISPFRLTSLPFSVPLPTSP